MDKVVTLAKKLLNEHKAEDVVVALTEIIEDEFAKKKISINHIEGTPESGWMLIDAHHVIINIFSKEERERISLEKILAKN